MANEQMALQEYYVYDPSVSDELGGLQVRKREKDKFVLATPTMMKYWVDQGLAGLIPLDKLSEEGKQMLAQVTRGRSENPDKRPIRVPRYNKAAQSGSPQFAGGVTFKERQAKTAKLKKNKDHHPTEPKVTD
jgi:hypothetical protein